MPTVNDAKWRDEVRDRYSENEKRIGTSFLTLLVLSLLYWMSFVLFLQDPKRELIPDARRFVEVVDQLEHDQAMFRTLELPKVVQVTHIGERFIEQTQARLATEPQNDRELSLDVQIRIEDRQLLGLINSTSPRGFTDVVRRWLDEIHQFQVRRIVYASEVQDLWKTYYALNQSPGWLARVASALDLPATITSSIPVELDQPAWYELSQAEAGVLFQGYEGFESVINDLQGMYQGAITDEMQGKTLRGDSVWRRNLDSGRSIARQIANAQPSIRLPVVGENVTGRVAFLFAPFVYLVLVRYLRILVREGEELGTELRSTGTGRGSRYPHVLESLSRWILPERGANRVDADLNWLILIALLLLPASTAIPVTIVNAELSPGWLRYLGIALSAAYVPPTLDTLGLLRRYVWNARRAKRKEIIGTAREG